MPNKKSTLTTLMNLAVNDSDYEYAVTGSVSCERAWNLIMQQGNSHFEHGRYLRAHSVYSDALALAHAHLSEWQSVLDGLKAVVVSALNLAATEVALDDIPAGAAQICQVHAWVLAMGRNQQLPLDIRRAALQLVNRTFVELKRFQMSHGNFPELTYWLDNSCVCSAVAQCQMPRSELARDQATPARLNQGTIH